MYKILNYVYGDQECGMLSKTGVLPIERSGKTDIPFKYLPKLLKSLQRYNKETGEKPHWITIQRAGSDNKTMLLIKSIGYNQGEVLYGTGNNFSGMKLQGIEKSQKDKKLEYFKKMILAHLASISGKEEKELQKAIDIFDRLAKSYAPGTIRTWKGKKYIKGPDNKWRRYFDKQNRGAKQSIAVLKKAVDKCNTEEELYKLIQLNSERFRDESGNPIPIVQELHDYIKSKGDKISAQGSKKDDNAGTPKHKVWKYLSEISGSILSNFIGSDKYKDIDGFREEISVMAEKNGITNKELTQKEIYNFIKEVAEKHKNAEENKPENTEEQPEEKPIQAEYKNIAELQGYAKEKYGIDISITNKSDFAAVKDSFAVIENAVKEYPGLNKYVKKLEYKALGKVIGGDYDFKERSMTIGRLTENTNLENFRLNVGQDIKAITAHELGHAIQNMITENGEAWNKAEKDKSLKTRSKDIINEALKKLGIPTKRKAISVRDQRYLMSYNQETKKYSVDFEDSKRFSAADKAIGQVSIYGMSSDVELVPECVTDYLINGENAQPLSKEVYKIVQDQLKKAKAQDRVAASSAVVKNKISEIIKKAKDFGYSRQLVDSMIHTAIKAGGESERLFLKENNIENTDDLKNYIDKLLDSEDAKLKNVETDEEYLKKKGFGKVGSFTTGETPAKEGIAAIREKYNSGKTVKGDTDTIHVGKEKLKGTWRLVEASAPSASHDENTFLPTKGFPTAEDGSTVNDRDYQHDKDAQESVLNIASEFDGRALSMDSPVVVTTDGVVISGNNRTMSSKLAAKKGTDKEYIETLNERAKRFGFTEGDIKMFKNPRVVFEVETDGKYTTEQFAKFNESGKKSQNPVEKAIKIAKTIKPETVKGLADTISEYDTISEVYGNKKAAESLFNTLQRDGIIQQVDRAQYITENGITGAGKEFVETVLIGSVVTPENIRSLAGDGGKNIRRKLVRAISPLVNNKSLGGYAITDELNKAIDVMVQVSKSKEFSSVDEFAKQQNMFESQNDVSIQLAKKLEMKEREFADFMNKMNANLAPAANGEVDIFFGGVETKEEILSRMLDLRKALEAIGYDSDTIDAIISKSLTFSGHKLQGREKIAGMDISIENKNGSTRKGVDKDGHEWATKMKYDYGYIRGTVGRDKDHLDAYINQKRHRDWGNDEEKDKVFVVHQNDPVTGKYDEDKCMIGWDDANSAKKAYLSQYDRPGFFGSIEAVPLSAFKDFIFSNKGKIVTV